MKRKLFAASLVLALLVSAYTAYACLSTRGLRVYLMGTGMGAVFTGTWQLTLLAAVILWIPGAVVLLRKVRGLRRRGAVSPEAQSAAETVAGEGEETELLKPQRGEEETELLETRRGEEETELLKPQRGEEETELLEPQRDTEKETELLESGTDGQETEPVFKAGEISGEEPAAPVQAETALRVCPNCGHPVSGKKFCARCGTRVGV